MKTSFSHQQAGGGFALIMVMCFLVTTLIVFGSVMYWLASSMKQTRQNNIYTSSEAAAEGATEAAFAVMDRDFLLHSLNTSNSTYNSYLPDMTGWPVQYIFSGTNTGDHPGSIYVNIASASGALQPLGVQYANLQGYLTPVTITATATPANQLYTSPATVSQTINFASVPAFQFAIFYNIDLEIDPGAQMPINGAVFSNGGIWSGTGNVIYNSSVEAAGQVNISGTDPFVSNKTDNGTPASNFKAGGPLSGVNPLVIPIGASTNNNATNVVAIIQIPPASVAAPQAVAYAESNLVYDFNAASLIVSNAAWGTNANRPLGGPITVYAQDKKLSGLNFQWPATNYWTPVTNDFYIVTNYNTKTGKVTTNAPTSDLFTQTGFTTNALQPFPWTGNPPIAWTYDAGTSNHPTNILSGVQYAGWSFLTNVSFYDYREADTVQAVQIDVSQLRIWITNAAINGGSNWNYALQLGNAEGIDSVYVYNSVLPTSSRLPAVRLINGLRLPNSTNLINSIKYVTSGLTVVTPQPLYVNGDYNTMIDGDTTEKSAGTSDTSHTYPAAFLADAITILSGSWSDNNNSGTPLSSRNASSTTINAACLEGIVPSNNNHPSGGGYTGYSGGVENFLRLLENWSGDTLTYNGSIMVMFPSQYATNFWQQTGYYYNAPTRKWGFDTNFTVQAKLPPLTPQFRTVVRGTWNGY